jgi:hypothetical protein
MIIGVGLVSNPNHRTATEPHFDGCVLEPVFWEITNSAAGSTMKGRQQFERWSFTITRDVALEDRTLSIRTGLHNTGEGDLPFRWFAHPFFPLMPDGTCCSAEEDWTMNENPGFMFNTRGEICMRPDHDWEQGHYEILRPKTDAPLRIVQRHPVVGAVRFAADIAPYQCALWANSRTFSLEPFLAATLAPGEERFWSVSYNFAGEHP